MEISQDIVFLTLIILSGSRKSQAVLDSLMGHYYDMGKDKLAYAGMDDAGEMSSWYVFNAIGFIHTLLQIRNISLQFHYLIRLRFI